MKVLTWSKQTALGSTLEANPNHLNLKRVDAAIRVDPLFHKTSAAFDEVRIREHSFKDRELKLL